MNDIILIIRRHSIITSNSYFLKLIGHLDSFHYEIGHLENLHVH